MDQTEIMAGLRNAVIAAAMIMITSSCANQSFQTTNGSTLSPQRMQNLVLRTKYPESFKIPDGAKQQYEDAFSVNRMPNVCAVGKGSDVKLEQPYYYLNTEVTRYKPGSPIGRLLMTPAIAFGWWGSFVDVDFTICDPATGAPLGKGVIRKANQWGGIVGMSITSET